MRDVAPRFLATSYSFTQVSIRLSLIPYSLARQWTDYSHCQSDRFLLKLFPVLPAFLFTYLVPRYLGIIILQSRVSVKPGEDHTAA